MRLGDLDALADKVRESMYENPHTDSLARRTHIHEHDCFLRAISLAPTIDAVPVTEAELKHLLNDTITYIWRLEDRGCDKPEFGYDSRKALLEKLKQFYKDHFQRNGCYCGEQKDGESND